MPCGVARAEPKVDTAAEEAIAIASTLPIHCCGYMERIGGMQYRERYSSEVEWVSVKDIMLCVTECVQIII